MFFTQKKPKTCVLDFFFSFGISIFRYLDISIFRLSFSVLAISLSLCGCCFLCCFLSGCCELCGCCGTLLGYLGCDSFVGLNLLS